MLKRAIAAVTAFFLTTAMLPLAPVAQEFDSLTNTVFAEEITDSGTCGETLTWTLDSEGLLTISGEGEMEDWDDSPKVPWYGKREDVKQVVIEDGVTSIGDFAFYGCSSLTSVTIPDGVTSIGFGAFYYCSSLTSVTIPDGVTSIEDGAFSGCSSLTSVTIPDSVTSIGFGAFYYCSSLTSVTIPDGVTSIKDGAFSGCSSLTSVTIPDSVTSIGQDAFYKCSSLTSVTIPDSVTSIGDDAFYGCPDLTIHGYTGSYAQTYAEEHKIPFAVLDAPEIIDSGTCGETLTWTLDSEGLLTISGEGEMENWGDWSSPWYNEKKLITTVVIKDGVTSIGSFAFSNCSSLTSVTIPDSVTYIGSYAFECCSSLTDIKVGTGNTKYTDIDGVLFSKDKTKLIQYVAGRTDKSYDIPDGVTSIGIDAFCNCSSLTSVTIPDGVTSIGREAFYKCSSLTSVTIPDGVTSIGIDAFGCCSSLTSVTIPDGVTSIGDGAFCNCSSLTDIKVGTGNTEYTDIDGVLFSKDKTKIIQYGAGRTDKSYDIPDSVTSIGFGAFYGCSSLTSVTIPDGVTSIGNFAFYGCSSLTSVTIPDSVTSIGYDAFYNCSSLTSVTIPDSVTSIGSLAFFGCPDLTIHGYTGSYAQTYAEANKISFAALDAPEIIASGTCGETLTWTLDSEGLLTISGEGEMEDWDDSSKGPWYDKRKDVKQVVIEDGVTSIGEWAFYDCSSLTSVTIPDGVTSIGNYAFYGCSSLTSVTIPDGVTSIGYDAFYGCSNLASVTIPDGVTRIEDLTFYDCSSLTSVTIPDSVTSIENNAFFNCCNLTDIKVGTGNTKYTDIDGVLFSKDKTKLIQYGAGRTDKSYDIPDSVTSIGFGAFYYCSSLTSVTIPDGVTSIGQDAFYKCSSLTTIIIPDGVTSIGGYAFGCCSSLTSVTIPDSVTYIGSYAFEYCSSLTSVTIPDGVTYIGSCAFEYCSSLTDIKVGTGNTKYTDIDGVLFSKDKTKLIQHGAGRTDKSYDIPDSVTSIGDDAFCNCSSLTSITIPDSVTSIGKRAFLYCDGLTSVTIPDSVTSIEGSTFEYCSSLTSVTIPDGVTSIGENAFRKCSSLTSVTIPDSVTSIGDDAFYGCPDLTIHGYTGSYAQTYAEANKIPFAALDAPEIIDSGTCGETLTWTLDSEGLLTISGEGVMTNWDRSSNVPWYYKSEDIKQVVIEDGVTSIGKNAFRKCSSLTSVTIPDSVTSIEDSAFSDCSSLTSVTIPDSVTSIGRCAFYIDNSLTSVTIPDNVTSIGEAAFSECASLTDINVGAGNTKYTDIDGVLFSKDKTELIQYGAGRTDKSYEIPDSVTAIGHSAFHSCTSLTTVTLPDGVLSIGSSAFHSCTNLISVTIPDGVTAIKDSAFWGCKKLTSITIPDSVTRIGDRVFEYCNSLTAIKVEAGNTIYTDIDGVLFNKNKTELVRYPGGKTDLSYAIPDGVIRIGRCAFKSCVNLTSVTIPDGVLSINDNAFDSCTNLASITISDGVTSIGSYAFGSCKSLTSVILPDSVTSIGYIAFDNCTSLTSITIPDSVTSIGNSAFLGCRDLTIHGYTGSYAQTYAEENEIPFAALDAPAETTTTTTATTTTTTTTTTSTTTTTTRPTTTSTTTTTTRPTTTSTTTTTTTTRPTTTSTTTTTTTTRPTTTSTTTTTTTTRPTTTSTTTTTTTTRPTTTSTTTTTTTTQPTTTSTTTTTTQLTTTSTTTTATTTAATTTTTATTPSEPQSTTTEIIIPVKELDMYDSVTVVLHGTPGQEFEARFDFSLQDVEEGIEDGFDAAAESLWEDGTYLFTFTAPWDLNSFSIIISTSGEPITYDVSYIRPEEHPVFRFYVDNWGFSNVRKIFGDSYILLKKYERKLKEGLTRLEQETINKKKLNWSGSCYGMAITSILAANGILNPGDIQEGANFLRDITSPNADTLSLINYYYLVQFTDAIQQEILNTLFLPESEKIVTLLECLEDGSPTLLCYYGFVSGDERLYGHAVVAYGAESGTFIKDKKPYNIKVSIYDNKVVDNDESYDMYINTATGSWVIPGEKISSDSKARIAFVTDDFSKINYHGYLGSIKQTNTRSYIAVMDTEYGEADFDLKKITLHNESWEFNATEENEVMLLTDFNGEDEESQAMRLALRDGSSGYAVRVSEEQPQDVTIRYENFLMNARTDSSRNIIFDPSGYIEISGKKTGYSAELTGNDGSCYGDWYKVNISGADAGSVILRMTEEGYVLHCDSMKNISVSAESDIYAPSIVFSADCEDVLIYEIDEETIGIMVDSDGDGTFDTEIDTATFGDINCDATINANDAAVILTESAILGAGGISTLTGELLTAADVDTNGKMDAADAAKILQYAAYVGSGYKQNLKAFLKETA